MNFSSSSSLLLSLLFAAAGTLGVHALGAHLDLEGLGRVSWKVEPGRGHLCFTPLPSRAEGGGWTLAQAANKHELTIACPNDGSRVPANSGTACKYVNQDRCGGKEGDGLACIFPPKMPASQCYEVATRDVSVLQGVQELLVKPPFGYGLQLFNGQGKQPTFQAFGVFDVEE